MAAAVIGVSMLDASGAPAVAQTLRPVLRDDDGALPPVRPRAQPPLRPTLPSTDAAPAPGAAPRLRASTVEAVGPDTATPLDAEADAELPPSGVRPAVRDGDPASGEVEGEFIPDGVAAEPEEYRNPDGLDPTLWDARLPEDSDAFERPPAGYDGQAFGVELSPLEDRRPFYLFRFEPWQARGIRMGSFIVYPQADLGAAWVSNLFRTKQPKADQAAEFRPSLRAVSNWRTNAMELRAIGGFTFFDNYPSEDDRAYALEVRGRADVSRRTQVTAAGLHDVAQESRGTLESRLRGGPRADVETNEAQLQLDHRFNRLALQLRGVAQQRTYEPETLPDGTRDSNRERDLKATGEAARLSWTFKPTFIAFAEVAFNQRRFEAAPAIDGIKRDSDGERYRLGVGFGNRGQVLRGEASIGYGKQTPLDSRLQAIDGVIIDANAAWRITGLTALFIRAGTEMTETTALSSPGGFTRRGSAELRHAFLRPLIGTASLGFATTNYQGVNITDNLTEATLGLEYYLGPEAVLFGRYTHTNLRTNAPLGGYNADEVRVGLRIRQ